MKYLIVNGDDFGASPGVTRGILEAHSDGILTSTSLMVDAPDSEAACAAGRVRPGWSVGLHVVFTNDAEKPIVDYGDPAACRADLQRQLHRFDQLMQCPPTHLDSHHNVHQDPRLLPIFLESAQRHALPLRAHSAARYFSKFYGQWDGQTHLEQISVENLLRMLEEEVAEGVTELSCHPGYFDATSSSKSFYSIERETELSTLCDPALRRFLSERDIRLIGFRDLPAIAPPPARTLTL